MHALNRSRGMNESILNSGSSMSSRNANAKMAPGQNQLMLNTSQKQIESSFAGDKKGMSFYNQGLPLSARNSTQVVNHTTQNLSQLNLANNRPSLPRSTLKETLAQKMSKNTSKNIQKNIPTIYQIHVYPKKYQNIQHT